MKPSASQSGNVIIIILIGIVLFAALSYAVTGSMRGGGDMGSSDKDLIRANEFLTYGNTLQTAVAAVMANGCKDTQISFENPVVTGYTNASAPSDKSCHIFDQAGGGVTYTAPSPVLLDASYSAQADYGQWIFSGRFCFKDVGTGGSTCTSSSSDLGLYLNHAPKKVCDKINSLFSYTIVAHNGAGMNAFTGSYGTNWMFDNATVSGKRIFCFPYNTDYKLVYTLLAR